MLLVLSCSGSNIILFFQLYPKLSTYPTYGTLDDSVDYVKRFIDPDYSLHIMVTKVVADIILRLSDSAIVPVDIMNLVDLVNKGRQILTTYESLFNSTGISLGKKYEIFCFRTFLQTVLITERIEVQSNSRQSLHLGIKGTANTVSASIDTA